MKKRILILALSLVTVLSMSVSSFAASLDISKKAAAITVSNEKIVQTIKIDENTTMDITLSPAKQDRYGTWSATVTGFIYRNWKYLGNESITFKWNDLNGNISSITSGKAKTHSLAQGYFCVGTDIYRSANWGEAIFYIDNERSGGDDAFQYLLGVVTYPDGTYDYYFG